MWAHKKIEISWLDVFSIFNPSIFFKKRQSLIDTISQEFKNATTFLSVRTGLDLILTVLRFPKDSEIIIYSMNIPDVFRIFKDHNIKLVPIQFSSDTLQIDIQELSSKITPNTKAIYTTHLFGGHVDITPLKKVCDDHSLLLIEDSAQYFDGTYQSQISDIRMFSFGTLKACTCLGGGIIEIKDAQLKAKVQKLYKKYPIASNLQFLKKLVKISCIKIVSHRTILSIVYALCKLFNYNPDNFLYKLTKGFPTDTFYEAIQKQPSKLLLKLMATKIPKYHKTLHLEDRNILEQIHRQYPVIGFNAQNHNFWMTPVMVPNRNFLIPHLKNHGFYTSYIHGLIDNESDNINNQILFLPFYNQMKIRHKHRLLKVLTDFNSKNTTSNIVE